MVNVSHVLDNDKGIIMIEKMLEKHRDQLPDGKTIHDFGGGYVEVLKTKAKVVLYFGFTSSNNRVQIKFDIAKEDVLRWSNAIAQKLWNKVDYSSDVEMFEDDSTAHKEEKPAEQVLSSSVQEEEEFDWN